MTPPENENGPGTHPATGTSEYWKMEFTEEEEPTTTGTLFLVMIILMIIAAIWIIMYLRLLER